MSIQSPLPEDHPLVLAWKEYQLTDEFANSLKWINTVKVEQVEIIGSTELTITYPHQRGSLWAIFNEGWIRGGGRVWEHEPWRGTPLAKLFDDGAVEAVAEIVKHCQVWLDWLCLDCCHARSWHWDNGKCADACHCQAFVKERA